MASEIFVAILTLTHRHELWAVTQIMKLQIQKTKMSFFCRVADSALEKGQELAHWEEA